MYICKNKIEISKPCSSGIIKHYNDKNTRNATDKSATRSRRTQNTYLFRRAFNHDVHNAVEEVDVKGLAEVENSFHVHCWSGCRQFRASSVSGSWGWFPDIFFKYFQFFVSNQIGHPHIHHQGHPCECHKHLQAMGDVPQWIYSSQSSSTPSWQGKKKNAGFSPSLFEALIFFLIFIPCSSPPRWLCQYCLLHLP